MSQAPIRIQNFIGGEFTDSSDNRTLNSINPATGEVLATVPESSDQDLERAVVAAQKASPAWRDLGAQGRAELMNRLADLLDSRLDELVQAEVDDNGMTAGFARAVEVPRGAMNLRAFARASLEFCEPRPFGSEQAQGYVRHEPVGVVGVISPWNLPMLLFSWKIAPALASGNCVVAKPSEVTPLTAYLLSTLLNEAGFPPGVLNLVHGSGPGVGSALTRHPQVARLSFTGSTATGRLIGIACAEQFKKPPLLEMGGKNPTLVFADADFEKAVDGVARAAFANQGQICLCGSRILIERSLYPSFRDALVEKARSLAVGDPRESTTQHGASISSAHLDKVLGCIERAREEGATVLCGGGRAQVEGRCSSGYFIEPTLLEGLDNSCLTNQEEIFGPVASLIPFDSQEEAITLANDSPYGLAASIWTQDLDRGRQVADALETGMPWINCWNLRVLETPFGGFKSSGNGHREGVPDAMEFFTEKKTVTMEAV